MYTRWKVVHYPYDGDWDVTGTEITDYKDMKLSVRLGEGKDSFDFKVRNTFNAFDNYFNPNDKLAISRVTSTDIVGTGDVLMTGLIKNVPTEQDVSKDLIRVEGYNFSEVTANAIVFIDATTLTIPEAIQRALTWVDSKTSGKFGVTWAASNATVRSDTSAFPVVGKKYFYVTLNKMLEELTSDKFTGDGDYYWYVNQDNEFVWFQADDTGFNNFDMSTQNYRMSKSGKDIKDVKNFIIARGGRSPANNIIMDKYIDYSSVTKHGYKY